MTRTIGTAAYSLRCGILKQGDPLEDIVVNTVLNSGLEIKDKDLRLPQLRPRSGPV